MNAKNDLEQLLKAHKKSLRIGDKRLADLANDYAGLPLVNRSSVRNWSDGSAKAVRDWRPLVAMAAAFRLDLDDANALLAAGDCPDLVILEHDHPDEAELFRYWYPTERENNNGLATAASDERGPENSASENSASENSASENSASENDGVSVGRVEDDVIDLRAGDHAGVETAESVEAGATHEFAPKSARREEPDQPINDGDRAHDRRARLGGVAVLVLAVIGAALFYAWRDQDPNGSGNGDTPVATEIVAPAQGAIVGETLVASGRSTHPSGVSHVDAVLVDMDRNIYWNPKDEVWQQKWRVFTVPVVQDDEDDASWEVTLGDPVPLLAGKYRFRVWSRSRSNRGDPVGPLIEFTVSENLETLDEEAFDRAHRLQNNPIPHPALDLEEQGVVPKARSEYPHNGSSVLDGFRLLADAEYEPGLQSMSVELYRSTSDEYWNFEAERWQGTPIRHEINAADVDCGPCQELAYDMWMPTGSTPPGEYTLTTRAVGVDGATYPEGETAEFSVIGP